jgi:hypothetical protein
MVDHTTLAIAVESVQTNLETRFDLANINQFDKLKHLVEQLPTRKEISLKLQDKLHKREFEKQFERLDNSYTALEAKVINAVPALQYEVKKSLETKASLKDLHAVREEKASMVLVEAFVKRLNKIEE